MRFALILACLAIAGEVQAQTAEYVGSDQCTDCHQQEAEAWAASHHALA